MRKKYSISMLYRSRLSLFGSPPIYNGYTVISYGRYNKQDALRKYKELKHKFGSDPGISLAVFKHLKQITDQFDKILRKKKW